MLTQRRFINLAALVFALTASVAANAQTYQLKFLDAVLGGSQVTDVWDDLGSSANPGRGSFPGTAMWQPIASQSGGGDARLVKVSNGTGGGAFPSGGSLYYGGFSAEVNYRGGTLLVQDLTPVAGLQTVLFQISIGEAWTYDFYNHELPTLTLNFTDSAKPALTLAATHSAVLDKFDNGTVDMPTGTETVYINTYGLQWDLTAYTGVASFSVSFDGVQHAQIYGLRLDQSDLFTASVIPEPSTWALLIVSGGLLLGWRRKHFLTGNGCGHPAAD